MGDSIAVGSASTEAQVPTGEMKQTTVEEDKKGHDSALPKFDCKDFISWKIQIMA